MKQKENEKVGTTPEEISVAKIRQKATEVATHVASSAKDSAKKMKKVAGETYEKVMQKTAEYKKNISDRTSKVSREIGCNNHSSQCVFLLLIKSCHSTCPVYQATSEANSNGLVLSIA